jgi:hypothetical protein
MVTSIGLVTSIGINLVEGGGVRLRLTTAGKTTPRKRNAISIAFCSNKCLWLLSVDSSEVSFIREPTSHGCNNRGLIPCQREPVVHTVIACSIEMHWTITYRSAGFEAKVVKERRSNVVLSLWMEIM